MSDIPSSSDRPIRFFHRGRIVDVRDVAPTRTLLDWLREDARCTGTKEGCNEGDCGACTVVIGEAAAADDPTAVRGLALKTVNACIRFLPTLDGKALFTVEDLKAMMPGESAPSLMPSHRPSHLPASAKEAAPLHPVQQAMVDCHGSQCGFCTPGFVMSLWSAYERCSVAACVPTRQQLADELSGNLCRCTGYRPIVDAGQRMFDLPAVALDTAPVLEALRTLAADADLRYTGAAVPIVATAVPVGIISTASTAEPTVAVHPPPARFHAPTTLDGFAALRLALPDARILAGSTDVGLWVNKQFRPLGDILSIGEVDELKRIETRGDALVIGAGASLESAFAALTARAPALTDAWLRFASPPIRNAGTLGGNVANGSPIGDSPPILMALDAEIVLRRGDRERRMPLDTFYVDYMKNRLEPGEFVQAIVVPLAAFRRDVRGLQDLEALRLRHLGGVRRLRDRARRRGGAGGAARVRRHGRDRETCGARRGRDARAAVDAGNGRRREGCARRRFQAAVGHAGQCRVPAAGGAEPDPALLVRDEGDGSAGGRCDQRVCRDAASGAGSGGMTTRGGDRPVARAPSPRPSPACGRGRPARPAAGGKGRTARHAGHGRASVVGNEGVRA